MNTLRELLAQLQASLQKKEAPKQDEPQQSTWDSFDSQYRPQLDTAKQNLLDQTAYTPQAEEFVKEMYYYPILESQLRGQFAEADRGNIGYTPDFTDFDNNVTEAGRHEVLHNLDDAMWGGSDQSSVGDSTGMASLLKKSDPKFYNEAASSMRDSGLYDMKNPETMDMEMFAGYGQDPQRALLNNLDKYSRIYQPMSKEMNYSPVYPSSEFQQFSPFFNLPSQLRQLQ